MKKSSFWLIFTIILVSFILSVTFYMDKVTINATPDVHTDQKWKASFSSPLKASAILEGNVYVVDQQGNKVEAKIQLGQSGYTVEVSNLKSGSYTLHVQRQALKTSFLKSLKTKKISFTVNQVLPTVKTEEELIEYFKKYEELLAQNSHDMTAENEGSPFEDGFQEYGLGGEAVGHSQTNHQVEGVDEADIVKTDGEYIYSISDGRIIIMDVRNPQQMVKISEIPYEESVNLLQLFLHEDTLIVIAEKYLQLPPTIDPIQNLETMPIMDTGSTQIHLYDVKDASHPVLIREIGSEGYLNSARLTNQVMYFVTNVSPMYWIATEGEKIELRPHIFDSKIGQDFSPMALSDLSILPGTIEGAYSIISAIDLKNPKESQVTTKGYLGGSQSMYMSQEALYLTAPIYLPHEQKENQDTTRMIWNPRESNTEIFKFKIDGTKVDFVSSGEVIGSLLNQFSMDEHKGYFRIVTTKGFAWDKKSKSENNLYILDAGMNQVGAIEGLAEGERIYSARFMGDKAYMVTFKETDPLFVMDVSNPTHPTVLGELKIPGFSNYLHPLDENHLIGFGYDTIAIPGENGSEPWIVTGGMKVSLFDVSNFKNPKEKDVVILGGQGTFSSIHYDHKALFQHRLKGIYGFPISLYKGTSKEGFGEYAGEGSMYYKITPENGIELAANLITPKKPNQPYEDWEKLVQRIVYIGDALYTISLTETKSYDLNTFKQLGVVTY